MLKRANGRPVPNNPAKAYELGRLDGTKQYMDNVSCTLLDKFGFHVREETTDEHDTRNLEYLQQCLVELEEARNNPEVPEEVMQKLRAEAEEASSASAEKARREAEAARAALEQARKELAVADGDMAVFKELFRRVQEDFGLMEDTIRRIGEKNAEDAEKLRGAVQALVKQWAA